MHPHEGPQTSRQRLISREQSNLEGGQPQSGQEQFKRFQIPPDVALCQLHQEATSFGFDSCTNHQTCPCCHQNVKQALCFTECTQKNIYKINQPLGFYYTFIKMMSVALLAVIIFPGTYTFLWTTQHCQDFDSQKCDIIYGVLFPSLKSYYQKFFIALNVIAIIVLYVVVGFLFYWNVLIHQKIRSHNEKAADRHSFVSGVDSDFISEQQLIEFLKEYNVQEVIYSYKIKEISKLLTQKNHLEALKHHFYLCCQEEKIEKTNKAIKKIDQELIPIKNLFELGRQKEMRTDKVFIKFQSKADKCRFQDAFSQTRFKTIMYTLCRRSNFEINNVSLYVQRLGDPRQIIWENLQIKSARRYVYVIINTVALIVTLTISFFVVRSLTYSQEQYKASGLFISIAFSIIILIVNRVLGLYIDFTSKLEGRITVTSEIENKLIKKTTAYFLNTTLIPFSLLVGYSYRPNQPEEEIVQGIVTLFIVGNLVTPIISELFLHLPYIYNIYRRRKIIKLGKKSLVTQMKANYIFEKNDFCLEDRYGLLCSRLTMCFFYAGIFSIGALVTLIGLLLTYGTSKYVLCKHSALPKLSFRLGILIARIAALFPLIYSLGFVLNIYTYKNQIPDDSVYTIIILAFSAPISLIFIIKGHDFAKKFVSAEDLEKSKIDIISEVSYKDLNPAYFFLQSSAVQSSAVTSSEMLRNMMRFTCFRSVLNVWRADRGRLTTDIRELERQQCQL